MKKQFILTLLTIVLLPVVSFSQKAYENVFYHGKISGITIRFALANGYIGASEIVATNSKTGKKSTFVPEYGAIDESRKLKFIPNTNADSTASGYFMLEGMEDRYEKIAGKIYGNYYLNGKRYHLTLIKNK